MPIEYYFYGFTVTLVNVFIKGFQHQNVIGGHLKLAFIFSYLLATMDIITILLVAAHGWQMVIPAGTGAAIGIVASMIIHRRYLIPKSHNTV